jgi:hypothetical protein
VALCGAVCFGWLTLAEAEEGPAEPKPPTARKKAPARDALARAKWAKKGIAIELCMPHQEPLQVSAVVSMSRRW